MSFFDELPDELTEYIFLHLSPYGEIQACRQVCHRWHQLANASMIRLQKLFLRCSDFDWFLLQPSEAPKYSQNIPERCSHAACFHPQGSVYIFGGCTAAYTTFNDLLRFDLATRCWVRPLPTGTYPTPKACCSLVEYRENLVLFGGWSKSSPNPIHQTAMFFNELHMYDPKRNCWTQVVNAQAPHLAGHSATVIHNSMIVFGGSHGSGSSNVIWVFDFLELEWFTPTTSNPKPIPRYGQSQVKLDNNHILIAGGCGGPNLIFNDVWLLTIPDNVHDTWVWEEITVTNPQLAAPQLWSHPACKVADKLIVLSKPLRSHMGKKNTQREYSSSVHASADEAGPLGTGKSWVPPQGNLIPPRRKLISSKSLDDQAPPPSPKIGQEKRSLGELQRAQSIPAIIVGEIPQLVVTTEDQGSSGSDSSDNSAGDGPANAPPSSQCIAMVASSLLPYQATQVSPPPTLPPPTHESGVPPPVPQKMVKNTLYPSVKPNANKNRQRQLEMLRRMEDYIRTRNSRHHASSSASVMHFRPSSPPPKSKHARPQSFHCSRNPMQIYALDLTRVISDRQVTWSVDAPPSLDAPEDTILYSLVRGRGELILFGGMRSNNSEPGGSQGNLDVTPFTHFITNETFILRPPISLS